MQDKAYKPIWESDSYHAIDWGCSRGGSIEFIRKTFGFMRIVGIDADPLKVEQARDRGEIVLCHDATKIEVPESSVSASFMIHFLEHLPSREIAAKIIIKAIFASRDFVLVRQPFFGADDQLLECGLKLTWSSWRGHPNKMSALDFFEIGKIIKSLKPHVNFKIGYGYKINSTKSKHVVPAQVHSEALFYDELTHPKKLVFELDNVFQEICFVVQAGKVDWGVIEKSCRINKWVYQSDDIVPTID